MNKDIVLATVQSATKGANIKLAWTRVCKVKKTCTDVISKSVKTVGRIGIDYDHQQVVQEKRENGDLPMESQPIWHGKGQWVIFPYLLKHVDTGQEYLRLYHGTGNATPHVKFFRNGIETTYADVENDLLSNEKRGEKDGDCFCCKIEDMTEIAWQVAAPIINREPVREFVSEKESVETVNV